jgi:hypothetical protein
MIKRILLFIAILAVLIPAASSFALVDHKNAGTIYVMEDDYTVTYFGVMGPMTPDSTTNWYTKAMYVGDCNQGYAWIGVTPGDGTSACTNDVNVFAQGALFLGASESWLLFSPASGQVLDQLTGTTTQQDTLNVANAVHDKTFPSHNWLRLYFDGQSASGDHTYSTWWVTFTKKIPGSKKYGSGRIMSTTN